MKFCLLILFLTFSIQLVGNSTSKKGQLISTPSFTTDPCDGPNGANTTCCNAHPDSKVCQEGMKCNVSLPPDIPEYCTPLCTKYPNLPGCGGFCGLNPDDSACKNACEVDPNSISCRLSCKHDPTSSWCQGLCASASPPTWCTDYCAINPESAVCKKPKCISHKSLFGSISSSLKSLTGYGGPESPDSCEPDPTPAPTPEPTPTSTCPDGYSGPECVYAGGG